MKTTRSCSAILIAAFFTACGGAAEDDIFVDEPMASEVPATEAPTATPPAAEAPAAPVTARIQSLGDSGVEGEATVTPEGEQTQVMVRLTGGTSDGSHAGHIHSGSCGAIGGVVQPLEPIATDAEGAGMMTVTVDAPPSTVMSGGHIIVYHGAGGSPIACAEIQPN